MSKYLKEFREEIHQLIREDNLEAAFAKLFDSYPSNEKTYNDLVINNSSYKRIESAYRRGEIDFDKMLQNRNRVVYSILSILDSLDGIERLNQKGKEVKRERAKAKVFILALRRDTLTIGAIGVIGGGILIVSFLLGESSMWLRGGVIVGGVIAAIIFRDRALYSDANGKDYCNIRIPRAGTASKEIQMGYGEYKREISAALNNLGEDAIKKNKAE